ncbi:MAG: methyltransferase domain-containing protein [Burkholderiaceae bacterium]|nr:methyltransferase domain-containing protein [Burkholderiaceae bacterium]
MRRLQPALVLALLLVLSGCTVPGAGDDTYRPWVGQHGKDVMWVPTLDPLMLPMLEAAKVTADDVVYDLGSGDGKIPIWAARRFGARAVGIEYNPDLVALARRNVERAGVSERVRMIHGDIFVEDFSSATVLTLFLGTELNQRLRPIIAKMRPGTRVVSNLFDMGDWEPDRVVRLPDQNPVYLWVVPARVDGEWEVAGLPDWSAATLELRQTFQKVEGRLRSADGRAASVRGRLDGSRLSFGYRTDKGEARTVAVDVHESGFAGGLAPGEAAAVSGRRLR